MLKRGSQTVRLATIVWLTKQANNKSSLHHAVMMTCVTSDDNGNRDASYGERLLEKKYTQANFECLQNIFQCRGMVAIEARTVSQ